MAGVIGKSHDAFGNALGNSIVSGLSTKPGELSKQTQRELAQAEKSGVVSPELARKVMQETGQSLGGLSVGLDGNKLLVGDGNTDWRGDLSQMDNYHDLSMARNSLISEFGSNMDTDAGRMLNLSFMQLQGKKARELAETPIAQSAAYLQGMAKGEARYNHINRDRIAQQQRQVQTTRQLDTLNKQTWQADQARAKMTTLEKVQLGFDVVGMTEIPGLSQIAELGSAGISLYNRDYVGAGLGVASMIPIVGKWAEVAKMDRLQEIMQEGHAIQRHGGDVTDPQLYTRATTGVAPDGSKIIDRNGQVMLPPYSSAFYSNDLLVTADSLIRDNYLERALVFTKPGTTRITIEGVDVGNILGRSFVPVNQMPGGVGPLNYLSDLSKATGVYQLDSVSGVWKTVTIYPVK